MRGKATDAGVVLAVAAAASFGISGPLLKPMMSAGWSPTALVIARSAIAAAVLLVPALLALRGRWASLWRGRRQVAALGLIGVAASQLAFAQSVRTLPVGTAILIQYSAPVLIVAHRWLAEQQRPAPATVAACVVTMGGLVFVAAPGIEGALDTAGVLWALAAMITVALYYGAAASIAPAMPAIAAVVTGQILGAAALCIAGGIGLLDLSVSRATVALVGQNVPWWLPISIVGIVATAAGFWASIASTRLLGSQTASFFGTLEVAVAVIAAWILLGERPTIVQLVGGMTIVVGIALLDRGRRARSPSDGCSCRANLKSNDYNAFRGCR